MDDRTNTIAGWVLFSGIVALGLASVSSHFFQANKPHRPDKMGYEIEGVVSSEEGGAAEVPIATLLASADVAAGEASFKKCASCHTIAQGAANGIGPNLWAVMGKPIGKAAAGYAYSAALSGKGGNWTFENMDPWLKSPKAFAPGTKMTFAGLGNPQERANVMAYLNAQGSSVPLPAAPAPAETPQAGAPAAAAGEGGAAAGGGAGSAAMPGPAGAGATAAPAQNNSGEGGRAVGSVQRTQANP
jgi:cytochrome c